MNIDELKTDVNSMIQTIDEILSQEDFSAYHQIKESLLKSRTLIENNELKSASQQIGLSFRLLSEAPPKNKELSLNLFHSLDRLYKKLN